MYNVQMYNYFIVIIKLSCIIDSIKYNKIDSKLNVEYKLLV